MYDSGALFQRAHNSFIDTATAKLYLFATGGGAQGYTGLAVYDISTPTEPALLNKMNTIGNYAFGHVHDGFVRNDTAYLNCGNDGFCVAYFGDASNPQLLGTMTNYPFKGYNHSGWLSADGRYYYMADETHGMPMKTVDVQDLTDIHVIETYDASSTPTQIPHNLLIACDYLFVSYYYDGLQVYDISDPAHAVHILSYDTSTEPDGNNYKGAWGVYPYLPSGNILISDMQNGLFVFQSVQDACWGASGTQTVAASGTLRLYPQPSNGNLTLEIPAQIMGEKALLSLYDLSGKLLLERSFQTLNNTLEVSLPAGVSSGNYVLRLKTSEQTFVAKL
ncbi:MAG: choice-of-anchor B family protein [Lewinellaceae bacterium]|nr:choice-of-anchor B family protein [Lewinellaceae bacterium]